MQLIDKYISTTANTEAPDATKTVLTDDAYAVCEFIEALREQIARSWK